MRANETCGYMTEQCMFYTCSFDSVCVLDCNVLYGCYDSNTANAGRIQTKARDTANCSMLEVI